MSISASKYDQISKAILTVLTSEPITFTKLAQLVEKRLPDFEGSVGWYTVSVARELEVQGKLVRHAKPVLYSKPARQRVKKILPAPVKKNSARTSRKAKRDA